MTEGNFIYRIDWSWLRRMQFSTSAATLKVALYIWYLKGVTKSWKNLKITHEGINNFYKLDSKTINRALHELENLGLITVERHTGRSPKVTIILKENIDKDF